MTSNIRLLRLNSKELVSIDNQLDELLSHFDYKLTSMNGISTVLSATIISEIVDITKFSTSAKLARYTGIAPNTFASGKSEIKIANRRGNKSLHHAFYTLALGLINISKNKNKKNKYFYDYFHKKLSEGKTKKQAMNCLQRRLVNIIWAMMTYKTEYRNPELEMVEEKKPIDSKES